MLPIKPRLTPIEISGLFNYNPDTGSLYWNVRRGRILVGAVVTNGYVKINGWSYVTARVIWCLHYKEWPPEDKCVDHINRRHGDNRIVNLRLATYAQNSHNRSGRGHLPKGVYIRDRSSRPWAARIMVEGKSIELGSYTTKELASVAYEEAALKYHGEFACPK